MKYDRTFLTLISGLAIVFSTIALAHPADSAILGVPELNCRDEGQISLNRCAVYWSKTTDFLQSQVYQDEMITIPPQHRSIFSIAHRGTGSAWWENDFQPGLGFKKLMDHCKRVYLP